MTEVFNLSGTSPASAGTVAGPMASGLAKFSSLRVEAQLVGATGGVLDVFLQRKVAPDLWVDWCHFTQLAAGGAAVAYSFTVQLTSSSSTIATNVVTTRGTDSTPAPGMAAGLIVEHPGDMVRVVYIAGASTSAGAVTNITITGIGPSR